MFSKKCLKLTNLCLTALFFVISIAEIIYGAYIVASLYKINREETLGNQYLVVPSLSLILFGITVLSLTVLGCCSFCKEVSCCVNMYSSMLLILAVLQILIGVCSILKFASTDTADVTSHVQEDFSYLFAHYYDEENAKMVDTIQRDLRCCGVYSPLDWRIGLPTSCCEDNDNENYCYINSPYLHDTGCVEILSKLILYWNSTIGYISLAIGVTEVLVSMLGFSLGCGRFKDYYYQV
ncbi:hypothetical protein NQ315_010734 [Exocentrus adspersus]|uniref:Tetraspanin n=1 Tax=Exocentrus adspersus TaxID=1586481 RepID=A0AAV8VVA1_9CUCU|nr:hypothetical protein NQ315_010734 [Exocentrus adspersus]